MSAPIEQTIPFDHPEHESQVCLREQRDVLLSPWESFESRLAKLEEVAGALRAILKWHPRRLNPQLRLTSERLVFLFVNLYGTLWALSDIDTISDTSTPMTN